MCAGIGLEGAAGQQLAVRAAAFSSQILADLQLEAAPLTAVGLEVCG